MPAVMLCRQSDEPPQPPVLLNRTSWECEIGHGHHGFVMLHPWPFALNPRCVVIPSSAHDYMCVYELELTACEH